MPVLRPPVNKKPAPKVAAPRPARVPTAPTPKKAVQPAPTPTYTPGELPAETLSQIAARRLQYSLQTGKDDQGNVVGPGFIERGRLNKLGDINAQRLSAEQARAQGIQGVDRNFASRGMGRSGLLGTARGRVEAAALDRLGALQRAEEQANLDAQSATSTEDFNWAQDQAALRRQGADQDYANWLQNNPNQGAQPAQQKSIPSWADWLRTHPWAKTPAQQKLLRANYDKLGK